MPLSNELLKIAYGIIAKHGHAAAFVADYELRKLHRRGDLAMAMAWRHVAFAIREMMRGAVEPMGASSGPPAPLSVSLRSEG